MSLRLYNTLTRSVEDFVPIVAPRVTLYSCGPTVWNYAHIGNFRTFLFVDLLRRWLEASGYQVYHIMNLTDVDDRIIKEAGKQGITIEALVGPFITAFQEDRSYLRITPAHVYPRATEFVEPMVRLVSGLLAKGAAYQGDDGSVYFAIDRFPAYGSPPMDGSPGSTPGSSRPGRAGGCPATITTRKMRRTSSCGRQPGRRTRLPPRRGTRRSAAAARAGTWSAPPWRSS